MGRLSTGVGLPVSTPTYALWGQAGMDPAPSCPSQIAFNRVTLLGTHSCSGEGRGAGGRVRPAARGPQLKKRARGLGGGGPRLRSVAVEPLASCQSLCPSIPHKCSGLGLELIGQMAPPGLGSLHSVPFHMHGRGDT